MGGESFLAQVIHRVVEESPLPGPCGWRRCEVGLAWRATALREGTERPARGEISGWRTLIAIGRSSATSRPRNTAPMPPLPSNRSTVWSGAKHARSRSISKAGCQRTVGLAGKRVNLLPRRGRGRAGQSITAGAHWSSHAEPQTSERPSRRARPFPPSHMTMQRIGRRSEGDRGGAGPPSAVTSTGPNSRQRITRNNRQLPDPRAA